MEYPMRISSDRGDPGYRQFMVARENGKTVRVYLDGVEVQKCIAADDEAGWVRRYVLDVNGKIQPDPNDPEVIWEERVEGDVRIVIA